MANEFYFLIPSPHCIDRSNAMQEILGDGGSFLGSTSASTSASGHKKKSSVPSSPSRTSREHGHNREFSQDRKNSVEDRKGVADVSLATVRESMTLREHDATLRIAPERDMTTAPATADHGTLYKQHYSGLEVCRTICDILFSSL